MKKQRWRKTKPKMKKWICDTCGEFIKVYKDYEPKYCCGGFECACYGYPLNYVLCDSCEIKYFGKKL